MKIDVEKVKKFIDENQELLDTEKEKSAINSYMSIYNHNYEEAVWYIYDIEEDDESKRIKYEFITNLTQFENKMKEVKRILGYDDRKARGWIEVMEMMSDNMFDEERIKGRKAFIDRESDSPEERKRLNLAFFGREEL